MVTIKGCMFKVIEDIVTKLGSFTILDINYYEQDNDSNAVLCDIEIATKRTMIMFHDGDLVLQRVDVDGFRILHINHSEFVEVIIR